nr:glycerophosphodiester phosphodiesterase family protein [Nocardioides glacieisoli]
MAFVPAPATAAPPERSFDLQAHRGGLGLTVESTVPAFAKALELGVSTLELDVQITEDRVAVVTHDRRVSGQKCRDTSPAVPDDHEFPYVGKYVNTLTLAQVKTLDCGSQRLTAHPGQELQPGERMPTLAQVLDLVNAHKAKQVGLNIETKVEAGAPAETAPREQFVQEVVADVRAADLVDQVTIQSFDWGSLMRMAEVEPRFPLIALTNRDFLQVDQPGASPWLGGLDIDDYDDSLVAAAASFGAAAISPVHGFPQDGTVNDPGYQPYVTTAMVDEAHAAGLAVVPWTVDDKPTMAALMDKGVDGLITDYPDRLRELMAERGLRLPRAYDAPRRTSVQPLPQAHAHNDYEHGRPLHDALSHGFTSVEADVWLVDGELLVAHDLADVDPSRTLESLYLDPLVDRVRREGGQVYRGHDDVFQLLIDVKSTAGATYAAVHDELAEHRRIMTTFSRGAVKPDAVTAVISGNRDLTAMQSQRTRYAGYDGRIGDLASGLPASDLPLLSDNWTKLFTWQGVGPMPEAERTRLHDIVDQAHAAGYRIRFWATPDTAGPARDAVWSELLDAGVDHFNTDDLAGLEAFLRAMPVTSTRLGVGAPYTMLQMNLCLSGLAGCYGRTAYPAVVDEAVVTIQQQDAEAVSLNEACSGDVAEIARRTGYQLRFAPVIYRGAELPCVKPEGRGVFGNAVLTKERIVSGRDQAFAAQSGVEERRWICATTVRGVTACSAHLSTRGTVDAQAANEAQCAELTTVLEAYDGAVVFGGDVNRRESCAPDAWWTLTDAAASQAPGIQHVYGNERLTSPTGTVVPATYTDHDFLRADSRLTPASQRVD